MRRFPLLKARQIECRVKKVTDSGESILLYKTARTDYEMFDTVFGEMNWQCKYEVVNGNMYCGIGVYCADRSEWIWKWNCGTESNTEAEKGEASDALKRAGFAWGCGTELYSAPFIWISADKLTKGRDGKFSDKLEVREIGYTEDGEINKLTIANTYGKIVYEMGKRSEPEHKPVPDKKEDRKPERKPAPERKEDRKPESEPVDAPLKENGIVLCERCAAAGKKTAVEGYNFNGKYFSAVSHIELSKKRFGGVYCKACCDELSAAQKRTA